ncbi:MAG: hypothetical protein D6683_01800 [Actinomyces sp.]|nr:MAG: hypothetical protein D6683_01800 [Actinomyces sp.]
MTDAPPHTSDPVAATAPESPPEATAGDPRPHPSSGLDALAGVVGAACALVTGELVHAVRDDIPSLVIAVAEAIVDHTPGDIVATSIETLGTRQKGLLVTGIVVVALAIGGLLARRGRRSPRTVLAGFVAFGLLGAWAAVRNPLSPTVGSWVSALAAAGVGAGVTVGLLARLERPTRLRTVTESPTDPRATRRAFLVWSGAVGAAAVTVWGAARRLAGPSAAETARAGLTLPAAPADTAAGAAAVPAGGPEGAAVFDGTLPGLSSFVTPNDDFYRIDTALVVPQVDPADWRLRITGMVDKEVTYTFDDILAMDLEDHTVTLSCVSNEVGGPLVGNAVWTGVPLLDLLGPAGVDPAATQVVGRSVDDWTAGFPTELLGDGRHALLAVGMNGEPLPLAHGFPARLVVAGLYGYVSAVKWVTEIHLTTWDAFDGYWIPRGWAKEGPMKTMSRIDVPRSGARVGAGPIGVGGVAWAPTRGISAVEIRIDDGPWTPAEIAAAASDETWVQWKAFPSVAPGDHLVWVRAVDGTGAVQPEGPVPPRPDGAEGWHHIRLTAT